ncbi:MAG: hypothetical protein PHU21_01295, partial [Elusimicrobia bacterium]|nr:hypothetical protein [Elusimicrobiota bacterium]
MMNAALLCALLALSAHGQPGPGGPPFPLPDPRRLAAEVRMSPTTARNAHLRFRRLMGVVEFAGRPPQTGVKDLMRIRRLLQEGRLTQAAPLIDAAILAMEGPGARPPGAPAAAEIPQVQAGRISSRPAPAILEVPQKELGAPIMLSQPAQSRPIEHPAPPAEFAPAAPAEPPQPR